MNLLAQRHLIGMSEALARAKQESEETHHAWLARNFADVAHSPMAERHKRLWTWFTSLGEANTPTPQHPKTQAPRVEVWPRGGAKSATAELACAYLATRLTRRFVLYVSATQNQADLHIQTIASHLEHLNIQRAVSKYGASRGWRRNQLRTAEGFHVAAYGLDGASRGIKIGRYRPDLIIFDDIDNQSDTPATVKKKIDAITTAIIPAGSQDCAILFLQNLIHEEGVVAQLVDGRADFLHNRQVPPPDPAVIGLEVEIVKASQTTSHKPQTTSAAPPLRLCETFAPLRESPESPGEAGQTTNNKPQTTSESPWRLCETFASLRENEGLNVYRIKSGTPTWEGQPLSTCEKQINDWGIRAFLREAQHEVQNADGYFFEVTKFEIVDDAPSLVRVCVAWDLAATEGAGDHTAAVLMGKANSGQIYVIDVLRGQHSSETVRHLIHKYARRVHNHFPNYTIRLPQDPGQAGKDQAAQLHRLLAEFRHVRTERPTGLKSVRASGYAEQVNLGNVKLIRAPWNAPFIEEHRKFKEDESHEHDDQIDAASDAFNELSAPAEARQTTRIHQSPTHGRQFNPTNGWSDEEEDDED